MTALFLTAFYAFTLSAPYSLGKLLAVALVGLWLASGRCIYKVSTWPLAYLAAVTLTTLTSADPWLSTWGLWGTYQAGLLCALLLIPYWACIGPGDRAGLERGLRWSGMLLAAVGLVQLVLARYWPDGGILYLLPYPLPTGMRAYSTMGSPIYVGAMGALCFPFCRNFLEKFMLCAVLLATGSRGAWAAVAAGAIYQVWPSLTLRARVWGLLTVGAGLCAAFWMRPVSDLGRIVTWRAAWDAFMSRPWFGWGAGNYLTIAEVFRNPLWEEVYGPTTQDHAHNLFLEAAATSGLIGLAALCAMLWHLWRVSDRQVRAALLGVFFCGMLNPLPLVAKALCVALAASCVRNSQTENKFLSSPIRSISVILFFSVLFQVYCDRMITFYGDTAWAFSSVKAAWHSGILKEKISRVMFKL